MPRKYFFTELIQVSENVLQMANARFMGAIPTLLRRRSLAAAVLKPERAVMKARKRRSSHSSPASALSLAVCLFWWPKAFARRPPSWDSHCLAMTDNNVLPAEEKGAPGPGVERHGES